MVVKYLISNYINYFKSGGLLVIQDRIQESFRRFIWTFESRLNLLGDRLEKW